MVKVKEQKREENKKNIRMCGLQKEGNFSFSWKFV